ncbi:MAG: cytochrome b [Pusillimonas sp.]
MQSSTSVCDSAEKYGLVTRVLHWGMALLFAWQFTSALAHMLLEDTAIDEFFWGTHKPVGLVLMVLVIIRALWGLLNLKRRPPADSVAAGLGHVGLYALMLVVPAVALFRQYGSGRKFEAFGMTIMQGFDESLKIQWMIDLGSNFHKILGYVLLAMIVGHVFFALRHHLKGEKHITGRML